MANYISKRGANVAPSYATADDLPTSTEVGDLVFVGGQLGIAVSASGYQNCDKTVIRSYPIFAITDYVTAAGWNLGASYVGINTVHKVSVASEGNATTGTNLNRNRFSGHSGTGDFDKGFIGGGKNQNSSPTRWTDVESITYSSYATAILSGSLNSAYDIYAAGASSSTDGYIICGLLYPNYLNKVQKRSLTSTASTTTNPFNLHGTGMAGATETATHAYVAGHAGTFGTQSETFTFAFASNSTTRNVASHGGNNSGIGVNKSSTHIYISGGAAALNQKQPQKVSIASGGTYAATANAFTVQRINVAVQESETKIVWTGGRTGTTNDYDVLTIASEAVSNSVGTLTSYPNGLSRATALYN